MADPDSPAAPAQLDALAAGTVLVAGDAMLDRYWFGAVERISPEAPVPVVTVEREERRLGGAGNVAANIAALGGRCDLLAVVGDDEAGRQLGELATAAGVSHQPVVDAAGRTTVKLRAIARRQQLLRADFESRPSAAALASAAARFAELLPGCQAVVLSDYGKGGLAGAADCAKLIELAAARGVPVLVDPKGDDFSRYRGATWVTPNLPEFEAVAGAVADDDDLRAKAEALLRAHDFERVLVTLSERGMALFSRAGAVARRPARAREVYDVSGAGDTVIAVMALAVAAGIDDAAALDLANAAAGVVVSKVGTAVAGREELRAALLREARETRGGPA